MPLSALLEPRHLRARGAAALTVLTVSALALAGCAATAPATPEETRAVVLVSGGGTVAPFTTPTEGCASGLSAGDSLTALREYLLEEGKIVYTAPAMDTWGSVVEPDPDTLGAFGDCPETLPESMTIMSAGDITASAEKLARFLGYLNERYDVTDVDLVGHSNGGLFSRGAIRILQQTASPITVRSLTTLGTPNEGAFPTAYAAGEIGIEECQGDPFCINANQTWVELVAQVDKGLNAQDTQRFLNGTDGTNGWNQAQEGYLDGIPVTLLAGTFFTNAAGNPLYWPYDGTVPEASALAEGISDAVIPHRTCWTAPLTHSITISEAVQLGWETAITFNPEALARVNQAIDEADTALNRPTRDGCP